MSVWLPTATCTPSACLSEPGPVVARPLRALRLTGFLLALLIGLALCPLVLLLPRAVRYAAARRWARILLGTLGVRLRVTREPAPVPPDATAHGDAGGGVLVVANHVSWLDIPLIAACRPGRSIAKTEVRSWPVLGPLTTWGGTVFLDRDRLRALPATVEQVAGLLRAGHPVTVFPEGSTWCGRESGRFRPAFFEAAVRAGVPVQPVRIRYRSDGAATSAPAFVGEDGLLASLARVVAARGLVAELAFLPTLPSTAPGTSRRTLAAAAQRAVEAHPFQHLQR
ncbi:lysophospholipid acyltransferase family protein [Kitasatospora sp. NPDC054939]